MTIRRVAVLIAFGACGAFSAATISTTVPPSFTVLPSSQSCTPPSNTVACAVVGLDYPAALTVTNNPPVGVGPAVWSFAAGVKPPGLGLGSTGQDTAAIAGSPTQAGLYTFTIAATYATQPTATVVTAQYSIAISQNKLTILAPQALPNGTAGGPINSTVFTASGGVPFIDDGGNPFYHWSIAAGSQADGLVMDQNSGTLSGTPVNAGIFSITIGVIDGVGTAAIHVYSFSVSGGNSLLITTTSLPGGVLNQAYSQKLQQTGGPATGVTWSFASGSGNPPPGLNISSNSDSSGTISGKPTAAGTYSFTVQASYQVPNVSSVQIVTATAALSITVATQLTMANPTAVPGFVNQQVSMQFTASGGTPPYTYTVQSGSTLPPGTALTPQGATSGPAIVSGQATQAGTFPFTIKVTDAGTQTATAQGTITITALTISPTITPTGTVTAAGQPPVTMTVGTGPGVAITGTLALTFANAINAADNPEVRYSDGSRKVSFSVGADGTVTLPAGIAVITGTVAGTGTLVATFTDSLGHILLTSPATTFTVAETVPVVQSFTIACSATTYTATIVGFSSTLDMTGVTLNFTPTTGTSLATPSVTIPQTTVQPAFAAWYANSASAATGSQFKLTVQLTFTVTGGASTNPIVSATAATTNSKGISTVSSPAVPTPACS